MSLLPIANRSFLHGDRKSFLPTEKIVYATLDSLALKRTRLPLQLLPVDANDSANADAYCDVSGKPSSDNHRGNADRKAKEKDAASARTTSSSEPDPSTEEQPRISEARPDFIVGYAVERKIDWNQCADNDNDDKTWTRVAETAQSSQCNDADSAGEDNRSCSSSSDYERIELSSPAEDTLRDSGCKASEELEQSSEAERTLYASVFVKSACPSIVEERTSSLRPFKDRESGVEDETDVESEQKKKKKKKKRFARNVLHLVPDYLTKGSTRAKRKKIAGLSLSLSSLKQISVDPRSANGRLINSKLRSRSLSRDELRFLKISSPTNFVHLASATSVSLVRSENDKNEFGTEPVTVITHEEKCATVPLLVSSSRNQHENRVEKMSLAETGVLRRAGGDADEGVDMRHEFLSELRTRTVEILERSQLVKTGGNPATEGKTRETTAETRRNCSFLWNIRAKNHLKKRDHEGEGEDESEVEAEAEDRTYDDVGPFDPIDQSQDRDSGLEGYYDDVVSVLGTSKEPREDQDLATDVDDGIYDDVICTKSFASGEQGSRLIVARPGLEKEDDDMSTDGISSSSESIDDIGSSSESIDDSLLQVLSLNSKELVNSLYDGLSTKSESEWEDLEEPATSPLRQANRDNAWSGSLEKPTQILLNKKMADDERRCRFPMKIRHLNVSRKTRKAMSSLDPMINDNSFDDSTYESLCYNFSSGYLSSESELEVRVQEEATLRQTLGRRIKMLRKTWSITKGSFGRMRRRTSAGDEHVAPASSPHPAEEARVSCNDQQPSLDHARYFGLARHFRKSVPGYSTFYLNGDMSPANSNGSNGPPIGSNGPPIEPEEDRFTQEPVYSNTVGRSNLYSFLDEHQEEPLYQFYAAAAVRESFDSNSDYYDDVVSTVSQSATDLVRPGHRTLWHQTPQVTGSDLLQRLSAEEKKIQEAKFEILTSEASYLNSLCVLTNEFMSDASINESLTPDEKEKLFGSIPGVKLASERFLAELEAVWRQDPMLCELPDVLLKYADTCSNSYVAYCSNQVSIDYTFKQLSIRKAQGFFKAVSRIEARPACQSLSLYSFLMLPIQRITRLRLLADAVLSKLPIEHPDRSRWETVLSNFSYVVTECNEGARAAAKEVEMESLARRLEYSSKVKPIPLKGKQLVKSGAVVQLLMEYKLTFGKRFNKTPLYLLLLTDYLLVANYKSSTATQEETYTVVDICKRSLIAMESAPEDSPFGGRNAILLTLLENHSGRQAEYVLTCDNDTERQKWLEAVSPSQNGLLGETLYEVWDCPQIVALYSYSPKQPDELLLHPGDVINVLRKMPDGWFHGEKLLDGKQGWFPGNYTKEVASEHVRARNLRQRHRLLALNGSALQRKPKQQSTFY